MSEITTGQESTQETGQGSTQETGTSTVPASTSVLNLAVESVMDLIDAMDLYSPILRGALGIGNSLSCEVAPSATEAVFYDKGTYTPILLALNGKHDNLNVLTDTMNNIMDTLTQMKTYPSGSGWEIVDITNGNFPRVIGREDNNSWVMACDIFIKLYRKDET